MKNFTKQTLASTVLATTLLGGHSFIKDVHAQWVNSILCHKNWITEIKKWKITVYNSPECFVNESNTRFFEELTKIKKDRNLDEIVVYPFYSQPSWKDKKMIIKIDGSQSDTWWTDFYVYEPKTGTLKNLNSMDLANAIAKVDGNMVK